MYFTIIHNMQVCRSDGLHESRLSYEDLSSSVLASGQPRHCEEFWAEDGAVRGEWLQWLHNKL